MTKNIFKNKSLILFYIVVILSLVIGFTYALGTHSLAFNVTTALVSVDERAYGSTSFDSSNIDFRPILDSEVEVKEDNVVAIDFTVGGASTNNNDTIIYDIALADLEMDCSLLNSYIKWKLIKDDVELTSGSFSYTFDTITDGRLVLTEIQEDLPDYSATQENYHDYTFYMWFSDSCQESDILNCKNNVDQSYLLNKSFSGKVEVELYTEGKKILSRNGGATLNKSTCTQTTPSYLIEKITSAACKNGAYTGSQQNLISTSVFNASGLKFYNYNATDIGNYNVTVSLESGYTWIDGTTTAITISCPIRGNITYVANGGTSDIYGTSLSNNIGNGESYTIIDNVFTRKGYVFNGWNTKADGSGTSYTSGATATWSSGDNITLYAQWTPYTYTISYNGNGSDGGSTANSVHTVGELQVLTNNGYTRTGYVFNDWNTKADGSGTSYRNLQSVKDLSKDSGEVVVLYAQWIPNKININYNVNGGTISERTTDGTFNYKFKLGSNGIVYRSTNDSVFTKSLQTLNYGESLSSISNDGLLDYNSIYLGNITKSGYITDNNSEWICLEGCVEENKIFNSNYEYLATDFCDASNGSCTVVLGVNWKSNTYNINFDANMFNNNGNVWNNQNSTSIGLTQSYDADNSYLTLNGSYNNSWSNLMMFGRMNFVEGEQYKITLTHISGNITSNNGGTLSFYTNILKDINNTKISDPNYTSSAFPTNNNVITSNLTINSSARAEGTTLGCWIYQENANGYTFNNYVVKVNVTKISSSSLSNNSVYGEMPTPIRLGYTFDGWYTEENGGTLVSSNSLFNLTNDQVLYAHWIANKVTIKYNVNGGNLYRTILEFDLEKDETGLVLWPNKGSVWHQVNYGVSAKLNSYNDGMNIKKIGYTAKNGSEWNTKADGTGVSFDQSKEYNSSDYCDASYNDCEIILYVNWKSTILTINYNVNGGIIATSTSGNTWTTDANGTIYRATSSETATNSFHTVTYNGSINLNNYNNSTYINVTKTGYSGVSGGEWICLSGDCLVGQSYSQDTSYTTTDFCDSAYYDCTVVLGVNWQVNKVTIKYSVNGGTIQSQTTNQSGNVVYTWTTDANGIIFRSENDGAAIDNWSKLNFGTSFDSSGLANWNNNTFINIKKTGYSAVTGNEWICLSGDCVVGTLYHQQTSYTASDFCDASTSDCTVVLGVNWKINQISIKYSVNGGTIKSNTSYNGNSYTWTTDSSGIISMSTNGGTATNEFHKYNYGLTINLYNYNGSYTNITNSGLGVKTGAEWICLSGCTTIGKTFGMDDTSLVPNDFCDVSTSNCTVVLGVNWNKLVTGVLNGVRKIWNTAGYAMTGDDDFYYYPVSGNYIEYLRDYSAGSDWETIQSTKFLGYTYSSPTVYLEKSSDNVVQKTRGSSYSDNNWVSVWIKAADVNGSATYYAQVIDCPSRTINGTTYYAIWIHYSTETPAGIFTSISNV